MSLLAEKTAPPVARPAPTLDRMEPLNLARRPFTNTRPVTRTAVLLWLLGLLLLLGNVSLFWSYLSGSGEKRAELSRMERQVEHEQRDVAKLEDRLANSDLDQQNKQARFLNRKIAERTFSWSLLFDRLAEVMPDGVRLNRLSPSGLVDKDSREFDVQRGRDNRVTLTIDGEAKSDEAVLQFVDNLFAHPAFEDPDLSHDSREDNGYVKFDIKVQYLPAGTPHPAIVVEEQPAPAVSAPGTQTPPPAKPGSPGSEIE
jgi:Tfp pilus assembly protein PilN